MIKIKVILAAFMAVFTVTSASAARDEMVAYLFTYFNSNAPEDEQKLNDAVIKKMSEDFADNLARATRNKNIEKIVDE